MPCLLSDPRSPALKREFGTKLALLGDVLIAIPINQGRVSPVLDVATRLLLVQTKGASEVERQELALLPGLPQDLVRQLKDLGVSRVICGAISQELTLLLEAAGLRVSAHICGEIESVLVAYRSGTLMRGKFVMPGCCRHRHGRKGHACGCEQRRFPVQPLVPK